MNHIAADIGNSRFKLEWRGKIYPLACHLEDPRQLAEVCGAADGALVWWISSVHRPTLARLEAWLAENRPADVLRVLDYTQLPLAVDVEFPEKVGMDRLLAAVAANARREPGRAAVIVDFGTAITVDLVDVDGVFRGGAIMPGAEMAADALHTYTDALPRVTLSPHAEIPPVGKNTHLAIQAGLYWSAVGAVRELAAQIAKNLARPPHLFLTGGGAELIARGLGDAPRWEIVPEMVLAGIREMLNA